MAIPVTGSTASRTSGVTSRTSPTTSTAIPTPASTGPFTREKPRSTTEAIASFRNKPRPVAAPMTGKQKISHADLQKMGAEILALYKHKVIDTGGRRLACNDKDEKWSIRGADMNNLLIHTDDGLIQLKPDGTPMRNAATPIESWEGLELGLTRVLKTLREVERPRPRGPGYAPA